MKEPLVPPKTMPAVIVRMHNSSRCAALASLVLHATAFLTNQCDYNLDDLCNITAGGDRDGRGRDGKPVTGGLHKNSLMKISQLRLAYTIRVPIDPLKPHDAKHWIEAPKGELGYDDMPGEYRWLWNPQLDTFERLELILAEAIRVGFTYENDLLVPLTGRLDIVRARGRRVAKQDQVDGKTPAPTRAAKKAKAPAKEPATAPAKAATKVAAKTAAKTKAAPKAKAAPTIETASRKRVRKTVIPPAAITPHPSRRAARKSA